MAELAAALYLVFVRLQRLVLCERVYRMKWLRLALAAILIGGAIYAVYSVFGGRSNIAAALEGYRASVVADYADRMVRIRDLETVNRESARQLAELRREIADSAERERASRERLSGSIRAAIESSGTTTDLLRQCLFAIDDFLGLRGEKAGGGN